LLIAQDAYLCSLFVEEIYSLSPKFLQKPSPYFFHVTDAPSFIWCTPLNMAEG